MRVKHVFLQNFWRQTIDLKVGTSQKRSDTWEIEYRYHTKSPKSEFDRVLDLQLEKALPSSSPAPITICGFCTINCQSIQYSCETMDLPTWLVHWHTQGYQQSQPISCSHLILYSNWRFPQSQMTDLRMIMTASGRSKVRVTWSVRINLCLGPHYLLGCRYYVVWIGSMVCMWQTDCWSNNRKKTM
jgi:hypothetical protein